MEPGLYGAAVEPLEPFLTRRRDDKQPMDILYCPGGSRSEVFMFVLSGG